MGIYLWCLWSYATSVLPAWEVVEVSLGQETVFIIELIRKKTIAIKIAIPCSDP